MAVFKPGLPQPVTTDGCCREMWRVPCHTPLRPERTPPPPHTPEEVDEVELGVQGHMSRLEPNPSLPTAGRKAGKFYFPESWVKGCGCGAGRAAPSSWLQPELWDLGAFLNILQSFLKTLSV